MTDLRSAAQRVLDLIDEAPEQVKAFYGQRTVDALADLRLALQQPQMTFDEWAASQDVDNPATVPDPIVTDKQRRIAYNAWNAARSGSALAQPQMRQTCQVRVETHDDPDGIDDYICWKSLPCPDHRPESAPQPEPELSERNRQAVERGLSQIKDAKFMESFAKYCTDPPSSVDEQSEQRPHWKVARDAAVPRVLAFMTWLERVYREVRKKPMPQTFTDADNTLNEGFSAGWHAALDWSSNHVPAAEPEQRQMTMERLTFTDRELEKCRRDLAEWEAAGCPDLGAFGESTGTMMREIARWLATVSAHPPVAAEPRFQLVEGGDHVWRLWVQIDVLGGTQNYPVCTFSPAVKQEGKHDNPHGPCKCGAWHFPSPTVHPPAVTQPVPCCDHNCEGQPYCFKCDTWGHKPCCGRCQVGLCEEHGHNERASSSAVAPNKENG